jgi:hypothetical protein
MKPRRHRARGPRAAIVFPARGKKGRFAIFLVLGLRTNGGRICLSFYTTHNIVSLLSCGGVEVRTGRTSRATATAALWSPSVSVQGTGSADTQGYGAARGVGDAGEAGVAEPRGEVMRVE